MVKTASNPELDPEMVGEVTHALLTKYYTLKDLNGISDEKMEGLYSMAFNLINERKFNRAEPILTFLCAQDQYQARYFIGLGICRQELGHYKRAAKAYAGAGLLDIENPIPALRAAECYFKLGKWKEARSGFEAALHWAGEQGRYADVRTRARLMLGCMPSNKEKEK